MLVAAGCSGRARPALAPPAAASEPVPRRERPFLVDPAAGYPLLFDPGRQTEVSRAHRLLVEEGRAEEARQSAEGLLAMDPGFHPAAVLAAQADFVSGHPAEARDRLAPVTAELPGYAAAQLLLGRAEEALGRIVEAFVAYRAVARESPDALRRGEDLLPRALEVTANRARDALARGHQEEAEAELARLASWGPQATVTLETARQVAAARGDEVAELAAVAQLTERFPERADLAERRATLELEVGDPGAGVEIFQALVEAHPQDRALAEKLEVAKFRWRLSLLPDRVSRLVQHPELSRGGFAVLLYWLVPEVRYGRPGSARIATDILDHPQREEIARVANLGLMAVDSTLHRFAPEAPVSRLAALEALLALLRDRPGGASGCAYPGAAEPALPPACAAAARCRLIADPGDCLPSARLSGREAIELIRRVLGEP